MSDSITDVTGILVGHAQDLTNLTGCTVVLCPEGATIGADVRGPAPGTRETDLCRPGSLVDEANAVFLTGGSAFGLDAAGGVMRFLWERGQGFDAGVARVPIVPSAVIFDLALGGVAWPDAAMAYEACLGAGEGVRPGCVGAGTGATVGKVLGPSQATKSGLGTASERTHGLTVGALVVVNAFGDVVSPGADRILAGTRLPSAEGFAGTEDLLLRGIDAHPTPGTNTTIGVVATDARLSPAEVGYLARIAHDGLARTIRPSHTMLDGDTMFALATGAREPERGLLTAIAAAATRAVERAVVGAVLSAMPLGGLPSASG